MISKIVRANGSILQNVKSCTFSESVNAETNLKYGCVSASKIDVVCYGTQADAVTAGEELTYYQVVNGTEKLIGKFYAEPAIPSRMTYSFTAYDAIAKLDVDFSARLAELQPSFPMTVGDLVEEAVTVAGVPWVRENFTNSGKTVQAFYADGITCREIVSWAAELASDFVRCSKAGTGRMVFARYTAKDGYVIAPGISSTGQNAHVAYRENGLTYANYAFSPIDAVAVHPTDDEDLAYIYPADATGDNILHIRGNLLLTNASESTYNSIAQSIYSRTQNISNYRPFEARLFPDENPFRAGDIVHVIDAQGVSFDTVVFSMTVNQIESILTATGEQSYSEQPAASAKNRLTNLAANIVRIKNLFVEQLEALAAQIDSLFTREITVTGSLHSEDYRQASGQPYAASGMALNFDTEEIIAPYFALDEYGNILGNSAYFGDMYFSDAMYGPESVINLAPDSMQDASGAASTNYEAVTYLRSVNNQRSLVRPGEVTGISGYQIGENGTFIYTFPKYTRYLRFWALCDSEQISELAVPHVKIYAVAQGHTSLVTEFDLTKYGTYQMPYNQLVSAVPYYYYPTYRTPTVSNYYQIEITLPNATCVCVDYAFGYYSAWHSYDNGHTFGGAGTYVGTDGISAQKIALKATPIAYPCNPNLIQNWYFAGGGSQGGAGKFPINQRLEPSYNGSGYTIDRWRINGNATSDFFLTVNSDCVLLENKNSGSYSNWLNQPFETPLSAGTYTLSILTKAVSGEARLELLNESNSPVGGYATVTEGLQKYTVTITDSAAVKFAILLRPGASVSIVGVKLELGDTQTLAHLENGVWVLNELPDYGEELAKCKRYYQRLTQSGGSTGCVIANVIAYTASSCNLSLRLGMRPTDNHAVSVTYSALTDIVLATRLINDGAELTNIMYNKVTDSGDVLLSLVASNALTAGAVYNAALKSNGAWIAFSTDL